MAKTPVNLRFLPPGSAIHEFPHPNALPEREGASGFGALKNGSPIAVRCTSLGRRDKPIRKWHGIVVGTMVVFCAVLTSCSFSLRNTKSTPEAKNTSQPQKDLVKPKIAMDSKGGPSVKVQPATGQTATEDPDSKSPKSKNDQGKGTDTRKKVSEAKKTETSGEVRDRSEETEEPFKKHNHAEYTRKIKNAAIDTLNKHKGATAARICSDTTTDLWTLTVYSEKRGELSFVIYFWDEVDGKWERNFDSGNIPAKKWKSHLAYSSSDKTCTPLKGAHLLGNKEPR